MDDDDLTGCAVGATRPPAAGDEGAARRSRVPSRAREPYPRDQRRSDDGDHGVTFRHRRSDRLRRWSILLLTVAPLLRWLATAESVPFGQPRRSGCDTCGTPIGPHGPLRALSPLARCAGCRSRLGPAPLAVEVLLLLVVAALVAARRPVSETIAFAWFAGCAVPLFFVDLAVHRLPDRLTYPAAAGTLALLGLAVLRDGGAADWWRALLAGVGVAGVLALTTVLFGQRGFGLGDAKLALSAVAVLGWLGWPAVASGLALAFVGSGLCALVLLAARRVGWRDHLPFGPFLILGTFGGLVLAHA
jgi:leader peptidase (prepilin peptidase)/N-methyltransferase